MVKKPERKGKMLLLVFDDLVHGQRYKSRSVFCFLPINTINNPIRFRKYNTVQEKRDATKRLLFWHTRRRRIKKKQEWTWLQHPVKKVKTFLFFTVCCLTINAILYVVTCTGTFYTFSCVFFSL